MRHARSRVAAGAALLLAAVAATSTGQAARATAPSTDPAVSYTVRFAHRTMDLTDGQGTLALRVTGSADRSLRLKAVILTSQTQFAYNSVYIDTSWPIVYDMGRHPVTKVSGSARSGVWRVRIPLRRHLPADTYHLQLVWRVDGVKEWKPLHKTVAITNPHSDTHAPALVSMDRPTQDATFSRHDQPKVSLHLRDPRAGVALVWVCYMDKDDTDEEPCDEAQLSKGTIHDGTWTTRMTNLTMLHPGAGAFRIILYDRVTLLSIWDAADNPVDYTLGKVIPSAGDFTLTP